MEELSMFDLIGDGVGNSDIAKIVEEKLKEKYDEDFSVVMIGNRYGAAQDSVTTYCTSKEGVVFTSILNKDQTILEDDFYLKSVTFDVEQELNRLFKECGISSIVKADIVGINKVEEKYSLQDFINEYEGFNFLVYVVGDNEAIKNNIEPIYNKLAESYNGIHIKSFVYVLENESYKSFEEYSKLLPSVNSSIIKTYNVESEYNFKLYENKVTQII